ncbi:response regulator transcription factor [Bacillus alkalicola]|uniref:Response regulator transcription factor n=1 Tax=Evansella alkalicola TaxID=745819 RepID=A0ABS6JS93_9BACI|nr:response regulator transcription factor [Bacillus alkalicola]
MKILIADDHHVVRKGLTFFFANEETVEVIAEAKNGIEVIEAMERGTPIDVILMDLSMPIIDGVEATKRLKERFPSIKILVLTSFEDQEHVISAIRAGADGYCLKDTEPENLIEAIIRVYKGNKNIDPKVANHLFEHVNKEEADDIKALKDLTKREREVLKEIGKGKSNQCIAESLYISEKTVKTHITNLLSKLPVNDRTQAALFAVKHKVIED